jgi:trans-2,3-dihydro-3-hydroxyanthranilate isomerase
MRHKFFTVDVFTDQRFGGNQLAVFPDASGIPEALMQPIAREFNYSETTFVLPPSDFRYTRRVRIFTPVSEMPFAGHPTVGTAHVLAATGAIPTKGSEVRIIFEEGVGPVPVTIRISDGQPVFAQLTAAKLPEKGAPPPDRARLARMLGLEPSDLADGLEPEAHSCGLPFLYIPLRNRDAVARAIIDAARMREALDGYSPKDVFLFAADPERPGSDFRARMFAPFNGIPEDPATGSAVAALAGYVAPRHAEQEGTVRWVVEQGFEMGRPSILHLEVDKRGGRIEAVRVGGSSVLVCEGSMELG